MRSYRTSRKGERVLAIVSPGQGSQKPGFLSPWLELPGFQDRLAWLSAAADLDLITHGTVSGEETIKDTAIAQPLIVAAGLLSLLSLFEHPADGFRAIGVGAGHSVGEITAAAATGVITAEQAMVFVRERGKAMAAASAVTPTGMSAVLGGEREEVLTHLQSLGLTAANCNGAGQIVAAGTLEQLAALAAQPPTKTRVMPLKVAGAFHTHHMEPASSVLSGYARAMSTHDARVPLITNRDGSVMTNGRAFLNAMVDQVTRPVRWDLTMETMLAMGVTGIIEIPPAGTLTGLAKRAMKGVERLALNTPEDIPAAKRMIEEHGSSECYAGSAPDWRLIVSPMKGTITFAEGVSTEEGDPLEAGQTLATISSLRETAPVIASSESRVIEWLVADGDPVSPGMPLLRLFPATE
nr:acyltransferase domain-containing protein [Dermatophilus congolensis]